MSRPEGFVTLAVKKYRDPWAVKPKPIDEVGIVDALRRSNDFTLSKRQLMQRRRRLERDRVGRWHFEYGRLLAAGVISEFGRGIPGEPLIVRLVEDYQESVSAREVAGEKFA